jgi:hypothetical protein
MSVDMGVDGANLEAGNLFAAAAHLEQALCVLINASEGSALSPAEIAELSIAETLLATLQQIHPSPLAPVDRWTAAAAEKRTLPPRKTPTQLPRKRLQRVAGTLDALRASVIANGAPPRLRDVRHARRVVGDAFASVVGHLA